MKQGAATLIHGLVQQGAGHIQRFSILTVPWHVPVLWHTQEVPQCLHVPCLAGSEKRIAELGLWVSCEGRTGEESDGQTGKSSTLV